ncbi:alpha-ketoglutarate-dependent dioxygenase AlkB [Sandaracinus amylolyticus]|uniref:Alkylated DNA repair protein AlkB n=1 Tax=Sandaracinus amylolyticus TaxID=927083 RepID=A0A0F6SDC4_9BACT|nr:alpha-ketoglutarate-dependent dioxygenase AlkB [Sandaracinus amylolyticus]AKF03199.1 Alkylated DNA repair protein AlkB [Sandaracinus amylolyticus]
MSAQQLSWLDALEAPRADEASTPEIDATFARATRIDVGAHAIDEEPSWIEIVPGWVRGDAALFAALERSIAWRSERRMMYERMVDVPRLFARVPEDGQAPPLLERMREVLSSRYDAPLDSTTLALYRDGADSVAWHRDHGHRDRAQCVVAVATLGGTRKFLVRPFRASGQSRVIVIRGGDLVVMGGACQRTVEHCVPKTKHASPRIALMFRHSEPIAPKVAGSRSSARRD